MSAADKADADQTGDGDDPSRPLGVCTPSKLRDAVDEYIRRGRQSERSAERLQRGTP